MLRRTLSTFCTAAAPLAPRPRLTINYMMIKECNMKCKFCYSTYNDPNCDGKPKLGLSPPEAQDIIKAVADCRMFDKITFAGGEPFLRHDLDPLLLASKQHGLITSMVTNGFALRMQRGTDRPHKTVEWVINHVDQLAISCDSGSPITRLSMGRALRGKTPLKNDHYYAISDYIRRYHGDRIALKMNSVITAYNAGEDMNEFIDRFSPRRWKVFQALKVDGQNDKDFEEMRITSEQFADFCHRHQAQNPIVESNDDMTGSYVMIDPWGRFFDNSKGAHTYSRPILEVGIEEALKDVSFDFDKYLRRGGLYDIATERKATA